jgi:hypothetical protein
LSHQQPRTERFRNCCRVPYRVPANGLISRLHNQENCRCFKPGLTLDKDVWVVWVLEVLFQAPFATHLVFKGGSSLSKAYQIIRRFSEDVDLTYDIRVLAPDLVGGDAEPLPLNRSQEKRWTKEIRTRLPLWINDQVVPLTGSVKCFV